MSPFESRNPLLRSLSRAVGGVAVRHRYLVLAVVVLSTALLAPFAKVEQDDDVLRFLPDDDESVLLFRELGERFHGLSIAIVGVEALEGDVFTVSRLGLLRSLAQQLRAVDGVAAVTGFTELVDVTESVTERGEEMSDVRELVGDLPKPGERSTAEIDAAMAAIRARVLSREHIVDNLVSREGHAALVLCQLHPDADVKKTADAIRAKASALEQAHEAQVTLHYAGAPFIGSFAAEQTREDLLRLSPFVALVVLLIMVLTARSFLAVLVVLASVGIGIVWVLAGIGLSGRSLTLVSSSLPALLVALGSAYSVHLVASVLHALDSGASREEAVYRALEHTGPPILLAGLTTIAGFLSFLVMDVLPMSEFGVLMATATAVVLLLTLLVVPAICMVLPVRARAEGRAPKWALAAMLSAAAGVSRAGWRAAVLIVLLAGGALYFASTVRTHTENRTLFSPDSEPVLADLFMEERFGGSLFVQIEVSGDIRSPMVMRQLDRLGAIAESEPDVVNAQTLASIIAIVGETMLGEKRVPSARETMGGLAAFAYSDDTVRLLVDRDWQHTLVQIKVKGSDMGRAAEVGHRIGQRAAHLWQPRVAVLRTSLDDEGRRIEQEELSEHLRWLLAAYEVKVSDEQLQHVFEDIQVALPREGVLKALELSLIEDELVYLKDATALPALGAEVLAALEGDGLSRDELLAIISRYAEPSELENPEGMKAGVAAVFTSVMDVVQEASREKRSAKVLELIGEDAPKKLRDGVQRVLWNLSDPVVFLPEGAVAGAAILERQQMSMQVSGYPMIYEAMNLSVARNQWNSLAASALAVFIILAFFFRSPLVALVALLPAGLTLLLTFAIMGLGRIPMDVGTSMIAGIALGVGIDYAVHFLWNFGLPAKDEAQDALQKTLGATGWGIVINALEVGLGLSVLVFGTVLPMKNFGLLTGAAMLISAICTLTLLPGLTRALASRLATKRTAP
ncbi:MAG: MMPL family transporter [Myxococcota bacterium]|jgi:predicted RND superfamily exporter protein|nr:MMPL family transporter [Myxococcota bacterium]